MSAPSDARFDRWNDLSRRLPWLLVFRAAVATSLFVLVLSADLANWPLRRISSLVYAVVIGTYLVVLVLGLLLRLRVSPWALSAVHLLTVVAASGILVHATGGLESTFTFLYLLTIFDGAIIGGQRLALVVAAVCALLLSWQIAAQVYASWSSLSFAGPEISSVINVALAHTAAFFLSAWLAGHLSTSWRRAREEAKSARSELQHAETLHAHVMESLPVGVITVDGTRTVRLANAALARILDVTVASLLGKEVPPLLADLMARKPGQGAVPHVVRGVTRYLSLSRSSLSGGPADTLDVLVVGDVSELHALEDSLRARERMALVGQLSAAMAHELRNPLAAISGCVELFRGDGSGNPLEREKLATIVLREIDRLNRLITDFLAYARPATPRREAVDVSTLVQEVCDVMRQDARWRQHELDVLTPANGATVRADAGQLRQVLWNLLKNALEACPAPSHVRLRVLPSADGVTVEVEDDGPGIAPSVRAHLFEPFHTTKEGGTGLGLAIVHSIVQAHGGVIALEPRQGAGTTARVTLPA